MLGQSSLTAHHVSSYSFGTKAPKFEKDSSVAQRMERLKEKYAKEGTRRSVDGVLVVYEHGHPHILLIQIGSAFFKLPGGRLRPGEGDEEGLLRKLTTVLAPAAENMRPDWRVGECLGTYYRPNFENMMYPYCPPHITRPKEIKRLYLVHLPEKCYFAVPKNFKLVAVPLFEIYDNVQRYGPVISAIPQLLSRFSVVLAGRGDVAVPLPAPSATAAAAPAGVNQEQQQVVAAGLTITLHGSTQAAQAQAQVAAAVQQPKDEDFMVEFD